jgi:hypothetical protein
MDGIYVTGWTELDQLLATWAQHGVFSVLIPFVLIFAVVFAILERTKVLGEKPAINAIIAIAIGLLSLQMDLVRKLFYAQFFSNFGTGLIILLGLLILAGLFITTEEGIEKAYKITGSIVAIIIFLTILLNSAKNVGAAGIWSFGGTGAMWISLAILLFIVIWLITSTASEKSEGKG